MNDFYDKLWKRRKYIPVHGINSLVNRTPGCPAFGIQQGISRIPTTATWTNARNACRSKPISAFTTTRKITHIQFFLQIFHAPNRQRPILTVLITMNFFITFYKIIVISSIFIKFIRAPKICALTQQFIHTFFRAKAP